MEIKHIIDLLESVIRDPAEGLPEDLFLFVSRITPMINVDLLIKNEQRQTLLTWRDDEYFFPGWHIPGGIIRYKEPISTRIRAVAKYELGTSVTFREEPVAINEIIITSRRNRAHFISLLYECKLDGPPAEEIRYRGGKPKQGQWAWHTRCPEDLISVHRIYENYI